MTILIFVIFFSPAKDCGECHKDIYKEWKNSLHANSFTDPVFQSSFSKIESKRTKRKCVRCHAPSMFLTDKIDDPLSEEGISCDFCHRVKEIKEGEEFPYKIEKKDNLKYGPLPPVLESFDVGHKSKYRSFFKNSVFCKGCHEYRNEHGVYVLDTYREWQKGEYSKTGIQCQNCHMPEEAQYKIVDPSIYPSENPVTAHRFLGGHSQINIKNAAKLSLVPSVTKDNLVVTAYIENAESGHYLPTGIPIRKIILNVYITGKEGKVLASQKKIYARVLENKDGKHIENIKDLFENSYKVKIDNRIPPKGIVREVFSFPLKDYEIDVIDLEAKLTYEYRIPYLEPNIMRMEMARFSKIISFNKRATFEFVLLSVLIFIGFIILLFLVFTWRKKFQ